MADIVYGVGSVMKFMSSGEERQLRKRGRGTWYSANQQTSCGGWVSASDYECAMSQANYRSSVCGSCLKVTGPKGTTTCTVRDECPECPSGGLDMTPTVFKAINAGDLNTGVISISYVSCSSNKDDISNVTTTGMTDAVSSSVPMGPGAIAGIVIGGLVVLALLFSLVRFVVRRAKKSTQKVDPYAFDAKTSFGVPTRMVAKLDVDGAYHKPDYVEPLSPVVSSPKSPVVVNILKHAGILSQQQADEMIRE